MIISPLRNFVLQEDAQGVERLVRDNPNFLIWKGLLRDQLADAAKRQLRLDEHALNTKKGRLVDVP